MVNSFWCRGLNTHQHLCSSLLLWRQRQLQASWLACRQEGSGSLTVFLRGVAWAETFQQSSHKQLFQDWATHQVRWTSSSIGFQENLPLFHSNLGHSFSPQDHTNQASPRRPSLQFRLQQKKRVPPSSYCYFPPFQGIQIHTHKN